MLRSYVEAIVIAAKDRELAMPWPAGLDCLFDGSPKIVLFPIGSFAGAFLGWEPPPTVRPGIEMSFRDAQAVPLKV
jgi:hypothetical protein